MYVFADLSAPIAAENERFEKILSRYVGKDHGNEFHRK
jgi:hypothetical protein